MGSYDFNNLMTNYEAIGGCYSPRLNTFLNLYYFSYRSKPYSVTATILDKTTWESFPYHVQQNYFQNDAFAERKPLPPIQCCFLQTPRDQAFFWIDDNIAFKGRGRGKNRYSYDV